MSLTTNSGIEVDGSLELYMQFISAIVLDYYFRQNCSCSHIHIIMFFNLWSAFSWKNTFIYLFSFA